MRRWRKVRATARATGSYLQNNTQSSGGTDTQQQDTDGPTEFQCREEGEIAATDLSDSKDYEVEYSQYFGSFSINVVY